MNITVPTNWEEDEGLILLRNGPEQQIPVLEYETYPKA